MKISYYNFLLAQKYLSLCQINDHSKKNTEFFWALIIGVGVIYQPLRAHRKKAGWRSSVLLPNHVLVESKGMEVYKASLPFFR